MILVVGGAHEGKLKFAEELLNMNGESDTVMCADGASDPPEAVFESRIVNHFHEYVRRFFIEENTESASITDAENINTREERLLAYCDMILKENPDVVIVSDLIGGGIVPTEAKDRRWRDLSGEACQYLAQNAAQVYRVICGIPQIIKGMEG